ncbi:MAG: ABC transporter substrate-binding protein [Dehalococcoidia bacterium]|jgi:peptide/nickel transport system substrate-binding protein
MDRDNYWNRRLRRRRLLGGAGTAALGATTWALAGCGDDDDDSGGGKATPTTAGVLPGTATAPTPTTAGEVVKKDGTLKSRQNAIFASINPYSGLDSGLLWGFTLFDHLWYTPLDTGVRENFLAASIEQQDAMHFTVKLQNSVFHDKAPANGRAVKASDVKASLESAAKQTKISNSSWWTQVFDHIETPDDKTVNFVLKAVDAWSFSSTNGGSPIASSILPEEIAKDPSFMDKEIVGSGRYQFVSHENGANFKLKRFDKWRISGEPYLAGIDYKLIQEQAAALAAFSAQEIDAVALNNKLEREDLLKKHGDKIVVDTVDSRAVWLVQTRADGPFADARVRQAIYLALDRKEMITLMNFGEGKVSGPVPPAFGEAITSAEVDSTYAKQDVAQAKQLLGATTFDLNKEYELKYIVPGDRYQQFAQIVQSQLNKNLGIKIKLVGEDFGKWLAQSLYGSQYDGFITYPTLEYDDPSSYIGAYAKQIGGRPNWAAFADDELDALVTKQKTILDDKERRAAVQDLQKKAYTKAAPYIPTFIAISNTANWAYVKGRVVGRGSYGLFSGKTYIDKG